MSTGYTAAIKDGIDFKTYAMDCARAFGACITLRDDPGGGGCIPDTFAPSDYHLKAMQKAVSELAELDLMTTDEIEYEADKEWHYNEAQRLARLKDERKRLEAYKAMLAKVEAWIPPTPDHVKLKDFMRSQIAQSITFECNTPCNMPFIKQSGSAWADKKRNNLKENVRYHEREYASEVERAATSTEWVRALRASL
jgi:hypothetical protein